METGQPYSPEGSDHAAVAGDLRRRATAGAGLLGARASLILGLGLVANIALARLLTPKEFGLIALGMAFVLLGTGLAEGGLGAALIRRKEQPSRRELEAVNGLQLAATLVVSAGSVALAVPYGRDGLAVAAMVCTLPVTILRTGTVITLERRLQYREIALVDVAEAVTFYVFALTTVAAGMGIWGVVSATAVRAVAGTALMWRLGPLGVLVPRWSWSDVRPLLGFGARMQLVGIGAILRNHVLSAGIAVIAGIAALGVWSLAYRILQVPFTLHATVARVAYPTLSRVIGAGGDIRPLLERGTATLALANGVLVVGIVGLAPAVPALVGPGWEDVPGTLAWSGAGLLVGAPIWVVASNYLFAAGEAGTVLRVLVVHTLIWFGLALPLVGALGVQVVGVGWLAAAAVTAALLSRATSSRTGARVAASASAPVALGCVALFAAWSTASQGSETLLWAALGVAAGELVLLGGLAILSPSVLRDARRLAVEAVRGSTEERNSSTGKPRA